jgi:hypothetical protein
MAFGKPRAPGAFAPRAPKPAAAVRAEWTAAIAYAGDICLHAELVDGGADEATLRQPGQALSRLMVALRDLAPENFPVGSSACRTMAGAFLHLARYLVLPTTGPMARTACAAFLAPGVRQLDAALHQLRAEEASAWRAQTGRDE